jgi:parvulin-like peptidyl-prolyl isomerase
MKRLGILGLVALLATSASAQLLGGSNLTVIKVGKTEFSQGKVDSLTKLLAAQQLQGQQPTDEIMQQVRWAVIDNVVGQELLRLEADHLKMTANQKKVDSLITMFKSQFPSEEVFTKELKKSGATLAEFQEKVRRQVIADGLLEKMVPYPADPTEAEKKAYFDKHKAEAVVSDTISGVQIYLKLDKGESGQAVTDKKRILEGLAAQWRSKKAANLMAGAQAFQVLAAQYSDEPDAKSDGGLLKPFVPTGDMAKALKALKVGEVSEVFQDKDGVKIFLLTERNDGKYESYAHKVDYIMRLEKERTRQASIKVYLDGLTKRYPVVYMNKDYTPAQPIGTPDSSTGPVPMKKGAAK